MEQIARVVNVVPGFTNENLTLLLPLDGVDVNMVVPYRVRMVTGIRVMIYYSS